MECVDCKCECNGLFEDPRTTPIDEGKILCIDCYISAVDDKLTELDNEKAYVLKKYKTETGEDWYA